MKWNYEEVKKELLRIKEELNLDRLPTYKEIEKMASKQMCSYIKRVGLVKFSKDLEIRTIKYALAKECTRKKAAKPKVISIDELGLNNGCKIDIKMKKRNKYRTISGEVKSINKYFMVLKTENYNTTIPIVDLLKCKIQVV